MCQCLSCAQSEDHGITRICHRRFCVQTNCAECKAKMVHCGGYEAKTECVSFTPSKKKARRVCGDCIYQGKLCKNKTA